MEISTAPMRTLGRKSLPVVLMMLVRMLLILPWVEGTINLYNSEDGQSLELYDCMYYKDSFYCRRPTNSFSLKRDRSAEQCLHHGRAHRFIDLRMANVSSNAILHEWKSSLEMVEEYSFYLQESATLINDDTKRLCECILSSSLGKYCEYLLPMGETFAETVQWQVEMRLKNLENLQMHSDIVCYEGLLCDSGLLCLDWRDVCDGVQLCMAGLDEENCDLLEFNECENDEYRCMNGMCIPDKYFLDGVHDCVDLSDEKQAFDGSQCTQQSVSRICDDRLCPANYWSCGDGQCIANRLRFQHEKRFDAGCMSRRDQYFMCEMNYYPLLTVSSGRCYSADRHQGVVVKNHTDLKTGTDFIRCALFEGTEEPCSYLLNSTCLAAAYPRRALLAPYLIQYYHVTRSWSQKIRDWLEVNGTIRCQQHLKTVRMMLPYPKEFRLRDIEALLCQTSTKGVELTDSRVHPYCHNESRTFTDQTYQQIDACEGWPPCISSYRIRDGIRECPKGQDEDVNTIVTQTCSPVKRHRFRCSTSELTCFYANVLGNLHSDCQSNNDELWPNSNTLFSNIHCNQYTKEDCQILREYIEMSWISDLDQRSRTRTSSSRAIPCRSYCDTFWNLGLIADEDIRMCQKWWVCPADQWQCATGQCIDRDWVLDEEWGCFDASDEENLFASNASQSLRNLELMALSTLTIIFRYRYEQQMLFTICDLTTEWPCFRPGAFDRFGNVTALRPCIKFSQIGDGRIDCLGAVDERNVMEHCNGVTMLGNDFKCNSTNTCIDFASICDTRCPNPLDDETQCNPRWNRMENCSEDQDFVCLNHQCVKEGWCNLKPECPFGEDERICPLLFDRSVIPPNVAYRKPKEVKSHTTWKKLQLPSFPSASEQSKSTPILLSKRRDGRNVEPFSSIFSLCNRGIAIGMHKNTTACFCPPQYYTVTDVNFIPIDWCFFSI